MRKSQAGFQLPLLKPVSLSLCFMKDHLFPCYFHVPSMAPFWLTMSVPCHSLGWPFKEKGSKDRQETGYPPLSLLGHSPSSSSLLLSISIFFFLFLSLSSGFQGDFRLSLHSILSRHSKRTHFAYLDLTYYIMTLLDQIEDRKTDRQIVDRKAPRLLLGAQSGSDPTY